MKHTALAAALLVLATVSAGAQSALPPQPYEPYKVLPPAEFDHPYEGLLWVYKAESMEIMRRICFERESGNEIACAYPTPSVPMDMSWLEKAVEKSLDESWVGTLWEERIKEKERIKRAKIEYNAFGAGSSLPDHHGAR